MTHACPPQDSEDIDAPTSDGPSFAEAAAEEIHARVEVNTFLSIGHDRHLMDFDHRAST